MARLGQRICQLRQSLRTQPGILNPHSHGNGLVGDLPSPVSLTRLGQRLCQLHQSLRTQPGILDPFSHG